MEKEHFARVVDESLHTLRRKLLEAYPQESGSLQLEKEPNREETPHESLKSPKQRVSQQSEGSLHLELEVQRVESKEEDHQKNPDLVPAFEGSEEEAKAIRSRLRLRLGALNDSLVSGQALHDACVALGLTRYTVEDMNCLVNLLAVYINLDFQRLEPGERAKRISGSSNMFFFGNQHQDQVLGKPVWKWPEATQSSNLSGSASPPAAATTSATFEMQKGFAVVPAAPLMQLFLAKEGEIHRRIFGQRNLKQFKAMREILLAGDTNRLVAELTFVRINDLAAPPEDRSWGVLLEPLVALVIVANGVMISFQTDPMYRDEVELFESLEVCFALFLVLELGLRLLMQGRRSFFLGTDASWNYFDILLAISGVVDVLMSLMTAGGDEHDVFATSLLRFCRLIRLVRIVKVFRLKAMKDLRLMVKGLVAGLKTLVMAFLLLFTVLYVISGFATMILSNHEAVISSGLEEYFLTIHDSMFTCFRCFTGECVNKEGRPIQYLLKTKFDWPFTLAYVASYMLVSLGIFNVILAVYVDITMKAAKENDLTVEQHSRESIRIARIARELLKKFAQAFRLFQDMEDDNKSLNMSKTQQSFVDGEMLEAIEITKELFLMVIQDRRVQALMDELELPPDRANLFEIIDADGSGTLQLSELVHGLLKIRGEISKSDVVAGLLATKAVQSKVAEVLQEQASTLEQVKFELRGLQFAMQGPERSVGSEATVDLEVVASCELPCDDPWEEAPRLPGCSKPELMPRRPSSLTRPEVCVEIR